MSEPVRSSAPPPPVQAWVGDIGVSATHVHLPGGVFAIRGSTWTLQESTYLAQKTSQTGIILAIVLFFFLCFFSLFFLLMKDQVLLGTISVRVVGAGFDHSTAVTVDNAVAATHLRQTVAWAQDLARR